MVHAGTDKTSWCLHFTMKHLPRTCILVKPVLRGHLWDKEKVDLLMSFNSYEISMTGQEKGDLLIQVTT